MGLIDYFRILKAFIILFLLHICLYEFMFQNQNGIVQEETHGRFKFNIQIQFENNIDTPSYFKMTLFLKVLQKSLPIPVSLCHIQ